MRAPSLAPSLPAVAILAGGLALAGCGALATYPAWTGGGLSSTAPRRAAEEEAALDQERARRAAEPSEIEAEHVLVMHKDSQRAPRGVTRTRAEARLRAEEALRKVRAGASFHDVVREYSDEPGAAESKGSLGVFDRGTVVSAFADAAFKLRVGEVSEIVETPFGFHIIRRTE